MIIVGVFFSGIQGGRVVEAVSNGALDSAEEAISLCIVMLGVVGLWSGIMNIAKEAGLLKKMAKYKYKIVVVILYQIKINSNRR